MVSAVKPAPGIPLRRFIGMNQQLDLYPDRLVLSRTDFLSRCFPAIFRGSQEILLDEIDRVYIHDSDYSSPRLLFLVVARSNHHQLAVMFAPKDYDQAEAMKNRIDDYISKREPYPEPAT
jgi:hypothetical protein